MSNGNSSGPEVVGLSNSTLRNTGKSRDEDSTSTTQHTDSFTGASSSNPSGGASIIEDDDRLGLLKELESVIESFRGRAISKMEAVSSVLRILGKNTSVSYSQSQKDAMFDSYLTEILSIQSSFDRSGSRGETLETPSSLESGVKKRAFVRPKQPEYIL